MDDKKLKNGMHESFKNVKDEGQKKSATSSHKGHEHKGAKEEGKKHTAECGCEYK